jgi:hypothetical protein
VAFDDEDHQYCESVDQYDSQLQKPVPEPIDSHKARNFFGQCLGSYEGHGRSGTSCDTSKISSLDICALRDSIIESLWLLLIGLSDSLSFIPHQQRVVPEGGSI